MTAQEFETTLRKLVTQKPFITFAIEYTDGQEVWVDLPKVSFSGGYATFLAEEGFIHFFDYTNVRRFIPALDRIREQAELSGRASADGASEPSGDALMTAQEFEATLRELTNKTPFEPFVVEYTGGERFWVDGPYVAFSGGSASFQTEKGEIHFFNHMNVRQFVPSALETGTK